MDPAEALEVLKRALAPKPSLTVRELWVRWADVHRQRLQDFKTEEGRALHVLTFFGDRRAAELTIFDLDGQGGYRARRQTKLRGGAPLRPATRNREVALLQRVLNFAVKEGLIEKNPIAHAKPEPEDNIQQSKVESEAKLAALLAHASPMLAALVLCWYETGARRSEVMGLRWDQLDGDYLIFPRTKNREPRRAKLAPRAREALGALPRLASVPWVFVNWRTLRAYSKRYLSRLFEKLVAASGLKGVNGERVTPHKIRHGFVYRCRRTLKLPDKTIQRMGGWKTDSAFKRYGITDEAETEEGWDLVAFGKFVHEGLDRRPPQRAQRKALDDEVASEKPLSRL